MIENDTEAFVYIWQDARQKPYMYYIGYHKGHPDDDYTHSSKKFESFSKDSIPDGVRRRVIATGTSEDMMDLETKLLQNRKERRWDSYYNVKWYARAIGDVRNILDENGISQWKQKISESQKGKPKPGLSKSLSNYMDSLSPCERVEKYGNQGKQNGNWKGGIFWKETSVEEKRAYHRNYHQENKEKRNKQRRESYRKKRSEQTKKRNTLEGFFG